MSNQEPFQSVNEMYNADIYVYIGTISDYLYSSITREIDKRRDVLQKNVILYLKTYGGDPDAAYRTARALQQAYLSRNDDAKFTLYVDGPCKSAGTLIAIGATSLCMSDNAELGPIDIQLRKTDEVGERTSGLAPVKAFGTLQSEALSLFKEAFKGLRFDPELSFSTKIAAEVATNMTVGLFSPVYGQLDPIRLAEIERSFQIAAEYGERLKKNLKQDALGRLLASYPSHSFVIDKTEAKTLFERVEDPCDELKLLGSIFSASYWQSHLTGKSEPFFSAFYSPETQEGSPHDTGSDETGCQDQGRTEASGSTIDQDGDEPDAYPPQAEHQERGLPGIQPAEPDVH